MIFKSHFFSMLIYSVIVSVIIANLRHDAQKDIYRYAVKLFLFMTGGVIIASWVMYFL